MWHRQPALDREASAILRDTLLDEISALKDGDDFALWAKRRLASKSTLGDADARAVEAAYEERLINYNERCPQELKQPCIEATDLAGGALNAPTHGQEESQAIRFTKPVRKRSKAHLGFVATQPCLVCQRLPCDAHHLKFAEPRAMGRKVSGEFTVPVCRSHHNELHRHGNEAAWWANLQIEPLEIARELWRNSPVHGGQP